MKKIITLALCILTVLPLLACDFGALFAPQNQPDTGTKPETSAYESILETYRAAIEDFKYENSNPQALAAELGLTAEDEKNNFIDIYTSGYLFYPGRGNGHSPHYKLKCGYAQKDLNGDGTDELVLLNDDYQIVAIFTFAKEKAVLLGSYAPRSSCWIGGDGILHLCGSSGANSTSHSIYKIKNGGEGLELVCEYGTDGHEWIGDVAHTKYYKLETGGKISVEESEYLELDAVYGKYLGSAGTEATKDHSGLTFTPLFDEASVAEEMYLAAVKGQIFVFDEQQGALELKYLSFPGQNFRFYECETVNKAIIDMDRDGINEYVIQLKGNDHMVLRYYKEKIYVYCFDAKDFCNLTEDGCFFYWSTEFDNSDLTYGARRLIFEGAGLKLLDLYKIEILGEESKYYIEENQVSRQKFLEYYYDNFTARWINFSPIDVSDKYSVSAEEACDIAAKHWGISENNTDGAAGTTIALKAVLLSNPDTDGFYYIGLLAERYSHYYHAWEGLPPYDAEIIKAMLIDAKTGEYRDVEAKSPAISEKEAVEIACAYLESKHGWKVSHGLKDHATGTVIEERVTVKKSPSPNNKYYHVVWNEEHSYAEWVSAEPKGIYHIYHRADLLIDSVTGECRPIISDNTGN